tara:strand:+ start:352 stop:540 length:189 start_codon:yes stop_codon:yes gene_type:complete
MKTIKLTDKEIKILKVSLNSYIRKCRDEECYLYGSKHYKSYEEEIQLADDIIDKLKHEDIKK